MDTPAPHCPTSSIQNSDEFLKGWLLAQGSQEIPPLLFKLLNNDYATEYPNAAQPRPDPALPEFQVCADRHPPVHKTQPHFRNIPNIWRILMHTANKNMENCNRLLFPRAGPLGSPLELVALTRR